MSWTDLMGKGIMLSNRLLLCTLLSFSFSPSIFAYGEAFPATLVCDDQINLALDGNCEGAVTVQMILEGESTIPDFSPLNYDILLEGPNGPVSGTTLTEVGLYTVTVSENSTGPAGMTPPFNSCWGHILVEDKLPPQLVSCPCEVGNTDPDCVLPILCEDLGDIGGLMVDQPVATDNCNNNFTITFTDDIDGEDCATTVVTRTWRLTDDDGNFVTCQSEYRIDPLALTAAINGPKQHVDLECGAGTTPEEVYAFFASEYRRLYPCGEGTSFSCDPLDHDYDADYVAYYEASVHQYALMFSYPSINDVKLDGNICNTVTTYSDVVLPICSSEPGCSGNAKVIRTWSIYDWCDPSLEPIKFSQVIKASDNTAPKISAHSFSASVDPWGCHARVIFPEPDSLSDNCASFVSYTVTGSGSNDFPISYSPTIGYYADNVPVGEHTFYYNAYDCCDNTTADGIVVKVEDNTPPVAITKQDIVVTLVANPGNYVEPGYTKIWAESVDNGSFDGCSPVKLEIRRETQMCNDSSSVTFNNDLHSFDDLADDDDGRFVTFCCQDLAEYGVDENGDGINEYAIIKVWLRVWDDGDNDGEFGTEGDNYSEVWSYVRLEDKSVPVISCPADIVIDCTSDAQDLSVTGSATANAACGLVGVEYEDNEFLSSCNQGYILRKWSVIGYPHINCTQRITVSGTITGGPIVVTFPKDTVITCAGYTDVIPTWNSAPCDMMAYSVDRDTFYFAEGACFKVLNYWTVINWCDYNPNLVNSAGIWSQVQVVKIIDDTAPIFTACQDTIFDAGSTCINNNIMLTNSAEDLGLCSSDRLSWTVQIDLNTDNTVDYTLSSTAAPSSGLYISPTLSGGEVKVTLPEGITGSMASHKVTWRVSDGCGNYATCITSFMVVDNIPPTPYCVNLSTALMENGQVELWACDFDLGAFDNCSDQDDLRFTFSNVSPDNDPSYNPLTNCSSKMFTCADIIAAAGGPITINVYVWDEKDNYDFCTVYLTLVDNNDSCDDVGNRPTAQIAGQILTEMGEALQNVDITVISSQPNYPLTNRTDATGHFAFTQNNMGMNYELVGDMNDNPLNGVSTLDLVLMQRHILGLKKLDSPFKLIAADINNDESVTVLDLLELRKLILGIYSEFPKNKNWRFINESDIVDPYNPWPASETRDIYNLDNNMMQEDFVGVKIGDVNNNVIAKAQSGGIVSRSSKDLLLSYNDVKFEKGEVVTMALNLDEITNLSGLQFTLETTDLELISIKEEGLKVTEENFAVLGEDVVTFSWNSSEMVNEFELFTISFRAKESGTLSNNVKLTSSVTHSEAYLGANFETVPVKLFGRNNSEQTFTLNQNNPNPFNGSTNISFVLPESSDVTLSVMDVTGRTVWSLKENFDKGFNSIDISSKEIHTTGILYYKLEAGSMSATKKMIILK